MPPRSPWGAPPLRGGPTTTPGGARLVVFTPAPGAPARRARSGSDSLCLERVGWTLSPRPRRTWGWEATEMTAESLRTTTSVRRGRGGRAGGLDRLLPLAGAVYVLSWLLGLSLGPSAPGPRAPAVDIQAYYVGHTGGIVVQSLLVHGLAGIALAVLALGFARALSAEGPSARWVRGTGLAAALVSLLQVVLALIACSVAETAPPSTSAALFTAVNDADTAKLLLLASFAATVTYAGARAGVVPGWLRVLGYLLVPLLVLGGLAFLVDSRVLYLLLETSLVVLLVWAASASWVIARPAPGRRSAAIPPCERSGRPPLPPHRSARDRTPTPQDESLPLTRQVMPRS